MTQRDLAAKTVRASWRHMSLSAVMCGAILVWYWLRGAPRVAVVTVVVIGAGLIVANAVRIHRAREAMRRPERLARFVEDQLRSRRVRGRTYLLAAPALIAFTLVLMRWSAPLPADAWAAFGVATLLLAWGWMRWWRVLRAPT